MQLIIRLSVDMGIILTVASVIEHIQKCMIAYLTDKWFMENAVQANGLRQLFAYQLGLTDAKVGQIFGTTLRTEYPILECVCSKAFENNCSKKDLLNSVNVAFKNVELGYEIEENEINNGLFIDIGMIKAIL